MAQNEVKLVFRVTDDGSIALLDQAGVKLRDLGNVADQFSGKATSSFTKFGASIITVNQALQLLNQVGRIAEQIVNGLINQIQRVDQINDTAKAIGLTTQQLSSLQLAAKEGNVSLGELGAAVAVFSRKLVEAEDPTSKQARAFKALGVNTKQDLLPALVDLLKGLDKLPEGATRNAVAFELLGRNSRTVLRALSADIEEQIALNTKLGATVDESTGTAFSAAADAIDEASIAFTGLGQEIARQALPAVISTAEAFRDLAVAARESVEYAPRVFSALADGALDALPALREVIGLMSMLRDLNLFLAGGALKTLGGAVGAVGNLLGVELPPGQESRDITSAIQQVNKRLGGDQGLANQLRGILGGPAAKDAAAAASKALDQAEKSAVALQTATEIQGKTALQYAQAESDAFDRRVKQAQALAATDNERRQIAVASQEEELRLAQQIDDATVAVLDAQIAVNTEKTNAHDITEGEIAQLVAQNQSLELQKQLVRTITGEVAKEQDAIALATAEWQRAHTVVVDLADTIDTSLQRAIDGLLAGGGAFNFEDIFKKTGEALGSSLVGGFIKAELAKTKFDAKITDNFTITLPGVFQTGADAISSVWSTLMDTLGLSTTQAASGVQHTFGDTFNAIGSGALNLNNLLSGVSRSNAGIMGVQVGPAAGGGFVATNAFGERFTGPNAQDLAGVASGTGGIGAAAGGISALGTAIPLIGIAIAAAQGIAEGYRKTMSSMTLRDLVTTEDLRKGMNVWGLFGPSTQAGKEWWGTLIDVVFTGAIGTILNALGLFKPPTTGSQYGQQLNKLIDKSGLPQQTIYSAGGNYGARAQDLGRITTTADLARFAAAGFGINVPGLEGFGSTIQHMAGVEPYTRYPLLQTALTERAAARPDVEALRTTQALGLGTLLTGSLVGGVTTANQLTDNLLLLGVGAQEAERELRVLAETAGVTLVNGVEEANRLFLTGVFKDDSATATNEKAEQLFTTIDALVSIFSDDIPAGVDVAAIALRHFTDEAGIDIAAFNEDLEKTVAIFAKLQQTEEAGLGAGLASAAASFAEAQRKLNEGAPIDQIIKQSLRARGELISALFDSIRQGFTTAITDGVFNAIEDTAAWTALKDTIAAAVTGGDLSQLATVIGDVVDISVPALEVAAQTIAQINAALAVTPTQLFGEADTLRGQATSLREQSLTSAQQEARYRKDIADADAKIAQLREGGITSEEQQQYLEALQLRETGARGLGEIASQRYDPLSAAGKAALEEAAHQEEVTANLFEEFGVSQETALGANTSATDKNTAALTRLADVLDVHQLQPSVNINWDALAAVQRPTIPTTPNAPAVWTLPPDVQRANPEKVAFTPQGMEKLRSYARSR